jgi:hypothetical protein
MSARALIVVALVGLALAACDDGDHDAAPASTGSLTQAQYDAAVNLARHEVENQDAEITSASAVLKKNAGRNPPSNTGHRCTDDQVLKVRLIGTFPHTGISGGPPGGDPNGGTVTEMDIKADADSGEACLISVSTAPHPGPEPGATLLQLEMG